MIEEETLIILGAGAGVPYQFPTGRQLRDSIINDSLNRHNYLNSTDYGKYHDFGKEIITDQFKTFTKQYLDSRIISIDLFLSMRPEFADIGKKAIVLALNESEKEFMRNKVNSTKTFDWMEYLYNNFLINGLKSSEDEEIERFKKNKISFITFNYDRSLEYFFWKAISNTFKSNQKANLYEIYSAIKIHHIYGDLGNFIEVLKSNQTGELGNIQFVEHVNVIKNNIKTIFERDVLTDKDAISKMFINAENIYFLGFGFAEENLRALNLDKINFKDKKVFTTGIGLEDEIKRVILSVQTSFGNAMNGFVKFTAGRYFPDLDCLHLIKKYL